MTDPITPDGTCTCCGSKDVATGGCIHCVSSRTFCSCGALLRCGCGRTWPQHRCPSLLYPRTVF